MSRVRKKDFEKSRKKYLTNGRACGKIVNVPRQSGAGRVPCKLNNVTNEKHQSSASEKTRTNELQAGVQSITRRCGKTI